ncbi:histidine phosphatase family protein, partial [uncultured Rothia sp.]
MTDAQNTPIITPVAPEPHGTRIILMRHGQTDWNIDHRFQGGTDIPLNDTGRDQVRTAIDALKQARDEGTVVDLVLSSPLSRAAESAEIVAEGLNVPYRGAVAGFQERSFGELEGQIATRELVLASRESGEEYGVEPTEEFVARGLAALNRVRREYDGKTVLVATHGMFIALMMNALLGERPDCLTEEGFYPIPVNASLTEVPLQYLDSTIDRLLVHHKEPELGAEEVPAGAENTSLTLIRHGQTDWNKANLMQGVTDIPLNDTGREQARTTGRKLAEMGLDFTVLVSSPLSR